MELKQIINNTTERQEPFEATIAWRGGAVAGAVATVAMGIAISAMDLDTLRVAIAGLYGQEGNLIVGWVSHLVHGTLFGILFAAFMSDPALRLVSQVRWKSVTAGVVYGIVLSVVGAGIIMPIWLGAVTEGAPTVLYVNEYIVTWHLIYGVVLGGLFPAIEGI